MIAEIERAICDRIRGARLGYPLAAVTSYGGEFDDDAYEWVRALPGVWVTYGGGGKPAGAVSRGQWRVPATFAVMVGARSVRGEEHTRHGLERGGAVLEAGSYRMLEDVRRLLLGQDLGLAIAPLEPGAQRTLYNTRLNGQAVSVLACEWHTAWVERRHECPDLPVTAVGLHYHLTPDDGRADASDIVTLS